ncbi:MULTISPECIES: hypothetical protein [unclassified Ruegeria]|uniref:hypothetical protein n=1 Tax=unclassified Ruegeria TaxID=2625375 RepID=UPI0014893A83|nr:hypothetical protein [Ruegeria sp. HKCCD8929]
MTTRDLFQEAERLERKLAGASLDKRLEIQPALSVVVRKLRAQGATVPAHLRRLDSTLCDEAIEARFDNMPV